MDANVDVKYDLIVIGGGSAGMAAAIYAAICQKKVLVFDAAGPSFDKPCGEGLLPSAIWALDRLGVKIPESRKLTGVKYVTDVGRTACADFPPSHGARGVRRRLLRNAMWQRALDLGVNIIQAPSHLVQISTEEVVVNNIKGAYLCIATGANRRILQDCGFACSDQTNKENIRFGMRRHLNAKPWSDFVEVYWREHCELYVTPVGDDCMNLAILSWQPFGFDQALELFPEVTQRLGKLSWDDEPAGRAPMRHRSSRVVSGRVLVAGDAAMFIDAMTGEGNSLAIRSGMAAARAIVKERPSLYRWYWLSVVWRYWLITAPVLWASRKPWLRRWILKFLVRWPGALQLGVNFICADPVS